MTATTLPDNQGVVYPYSIKISDTAKGIRLDVHTYANTEDDVIDRAFRTYLRARQKAMDNHIPLAPVEANSK